MSVELSLPNCTGMPNVDEAKLCQEAEAVLRALDFEDAELSIRLVDDVEMAELNSNYRAKSGPTDVLSFSLMTGEHAEYRGALLGDVVIDLQVAERQAGEIGHGLQEELVRLLIHGVLHLLGHDHEQDEEARIMQAEEQRIWQTLQK